MHQADAADAEAAHKWNLKQFMRLVPHGRYLTEHLVGRHLDQLLFTGTGPDWAPKKQEPKRFCRCQQDVCDHDPHVHVLMPGLQPEEDVHGFLHRLPDVRDGTRYIERVVIDEDTDEDFQRALRAMVGRVLGVPWETAEPPPVVYRAKRMKLKWHNLEGLLEYEETFHASDDYYKKGCWYDAVKARHAVPTHGPTRRLPEERSARERRAMRAAAAAGERYDGSTAEDVAFIRGLYFCAVPGAHFPHQGEQQFIQPFMHIEWCRYFNAFREMEVPDGEAADLGRCQELLAEWDIEGIRPDPHELPYMLLPDEVAGIAYLQQGFYEPRAGVPDFHFVDMMWDKM